MNYVQQFQELDGSNIAIAGGKGANLGALTQAGFPVPSGFVLTTRAYDDFVQVTDLQAQIVELASVINGDEPRSMEKASAAIQSLFVESDIMDTISDELLAAYQYLADGRDNSVAVRSSATAEDLPGASFAGQHESFLNVRGNEALIDAVKRCWASLWTDRAMSYRQRQGIAPADVSLAVVVQVMVDADVSGILFTANPATGNRDEMVIEASYGLGEAIVGGLVTPDSYGVNRTSGEIVESVIGAKEQRVVSSADGGVTTESTDPETQQSTTLSGETIQKLEQLGEQIESSFGLPQDIEWAMQDGALWIVQARPITHLPPAPLTDITWEPPRPDVKLIRRQVVEHMPEPLSPLFDDLYLNLGLDRSMEALFSAFNFDIELANIVERPMFLTVNGYAYSRANYQINAKILPSAIKAYVQMVPPLMRNATGRWRDDILPTHLENIRQWKTLDPGSATDGQLWCGILSLTIADAILWYEVSILLGLAKVTDNLLNWLVGRFGDPRGQGTRLTSGLFLRGLPSITIEAQIDLDAIAGQLRADPALRELVLETPASSLLTVLRTEPAAAEAVWGVDAYLDKYGHQIYGLDFADPTQGEDPLPILVGLRTLVQEPADTIQRQADMAADREALTKQTTQSLEPPLDWIFQTLLGWAQKFAPDREEALFYVGSGWPTLRRFAHELGSRLVKNGALYEVDDIFYLHKDEIEAALVKRFSGEIVSDTRKVALNRRTLRDARKSLTPPAKIPDVPFKVGPIPMAIFETQKAGNDENGDLCGFAVSPGRVTAPATIIRSTNDFEKMQPGTILVCPTTTPAWTPLFSQAKGLVTEIGGILAHGSIVAREYGIPAVMGISGATRRIEDGQMITVDGNHGTVTIAQNVEA